MPHSPLIFYTNPMSRGQIIRWMLEEVGADYETQILDYESGLTSPSYLAPLRERPAYQQAKAIDNALIAKMQSEG